MDKLLDTHRSRFVLREATPGELDQHKAVLKSAIRTSSLINDLIDPDFDPPDLMARLKIRIQQLDDAYNTFHDRELSDAEVEKILKNAFPE